MGLPIAIVPPPGKKAFAHSGLRNRRQIARRNDLVGINVFHPQRHAGRSQLCEGLHQSISRTSTTRPLTAAAAAMIGLISSERLPGPCRPTKLRLLVLATYFPSPRLVIVHRQAHAATGAAPLETGLAEDAVQPLCLGLGLDGLRPRHDQRLNVIGDAPSFGDRRGRAQIFDTAVGAGADEDDVDVLSFDRLTLAQPHVVEGIPQAALVRRVLQLFRLRDAPGHGHALAGVGAVGHHWRQCASVQRQLAVENRVIVRPQRAPAGDGAFPFVVFGGVFSAFDVLESSYHQGRSDPRARRLRCSCCRWSCGWPC